MPQENSQFAARNYVLPQESKFAVRFIEQNKKY